LEGFGIRLNQKPPNIIFKRKDKGGIGITKACPLTKLDSKMIQSICKEYKIANADLTFREDCNVDQLIDVIEGNRKYTPCIYVLNKCDAITLEELELLSQVPHYVPICARKEWGFDDLLEKMWNYLNMIRMYVVSTNNYILAHNYPGNIDKLIGSFYTEQTVHIMIMIICRFIFLADQLSYLPCVCFVFFLCFILSVYFLCFFPHSYTKPKGQIPDVSNCLSFQMRIVSITSLHEDYHLFYLHPS